MPVEWRVTRELAIKKIDAKEEAFYTIDKTTGKKVYVGVVRGDGNKAPYLRTYADGKWQDNLLALSRMHWSLQDRGVVGNRGGVRSLR